MGNIINLRQARKQKTRTEKRETSAAVTAISGVKKSERTRVTHLKAMVDRGLDGHKLDDKVD